MVLPALAKHQRLQVHRKDLSPAYGHFCALIRIYYLDYVQYCVNYEGSLRAQMIGPYLFRASNNHKLQTNGRLVHVQRRHFRSNSVLVTGAARATNHFDFTIGPYCSTSISRPDSPARNLYVISAGRLACANVRRAVCMILRTTCAISTVSGSKGVRGPLTSIPQTNRALTPSQKMMSFQKKKNERKKSKTPLRPLGNFGLFRAGAE